MANWQPEGFETDSGMSGRRWGQRCRWLRLSALCLALWNCGSPDTGELFRSNNPASPGPSAPSGISGEMRVAASDASTPPASGTGSAVAGAGVAPPAPANSQSTAGVPTSAAETRSEPGAGGAAPEPATPGGEDPPPERDPAASISVIRIERARWKEDDEELEVRGEVSSTRVALTVSFLGRSENVSNDAGSFRGEFPVVDQPDRVTVTADDGATASADVEVELELD
jgi:hypothetical protein